MTATPIVAPPYGSPEWVAWRNRGLGASDLPTLTGDNPWQSEYQLAAVKRGLAEPDPENEAMRWGHRLERVGIDLYRELTGRMVVTGETFGRQDHPHLWATLDGRVPGDAIGVEVKATRHRWDELPRRIVVQCLAQMGLADLAAVDVVVLPFPAEPAVIRVERDEAAIGDLLALGEEWWARYVQGDEMPPLDESPAARKALRGLRGDEERIADDRQRSLLIQLRKAQHELEVWGRIEDICKRDLKASMAGAGVLVSPDARVTWSAVKPRTTVDWKAIAAVAGRDWDPEVWEALVRDHTTTGEPGDTFRVRFTEALEEAA